MAVNLIDCLTNRLNSALNDSILSTDHKKRITEIKQLLEPYTQYVLNLMKDKEHIFGSNFKKNSKTNNNTCLKNNYEQKESWSQKHRNHDMTNVKNKDEGNWRTLKPDPNPKQHVFSRGYQKQISDNGMEIRTRFNFKK